MTYLLVLHSGWFKTKGAATDKQAVPREEAVTDKRYKSYNFESPVAHICRMLTATVAMGRMM